MFTVIWSLFIILYLLYILRSDGYILLRTEQKLYSETRQLFSKYYTNAIFV